MAVLTVALARNESRMVRHFVRHYRRLGDVTIYDDHSTDDTMDVARAEGATVFPIGTIECDDVERRLMWVKNHSWKPVRDDYDWVIAVDVDEFLYHEDLPGVLRHSHQLGALVLLPCGYEMYAFGSPQEDIPLLAQARRGALSRLYSKPCCFDPKRLDEINFEGGGHHASPRHALHYFFPYPGLKLLHYRCLGAAWVVDRMSNQARPWSVDPVQMQADIAALDARSVEVVPEGPIEWSEPVPGPRSEPVEVYPAGPFKVIPTVPKRLPQVHTPDLSYAAAQPMGRWFLREPVLPNAGPG